jgi:predicted MFS family arabinose efflux permease
LKPTSIEPSVPSPSGAGQEFRRSWRIALAALIGVAFGYNGFSYAAFGVMVEPLSQAFGRSVSAVNFCVTFLFLGNIAASPFVGMVADRIGARRVILYSLPLLILTWFVAGTIGLRLWILYALAVFAGCIGTGAGPIAYGRAVNTWFKAGRGAALGIMSAGIGLSYVFGPRMLQAVVDARGWRVGFFFMAAAHVIPLPFILRWLRERRETAVQNSRPMETGFSWREVLRLPVFWCAAAGFILYGFCAGGITVNLVPFLTASGLSRGTAASYMGLLGVFSLAGRLLTGFVIDRLPVGPVCAVILLLEAMAFAAFGLFGASAVGVAISVTGFAFGGEVSCMSYAIARYFGVRSYGAINGMMSVVVGIGVGLGPPLIGLLKEFSGSYRVPFLTASGVACAAAVFFAALAFYPYFKESDDSGSVE